MTRYYIIYLRPVALARGLCMHLLFFYSSDKITKYLKAYEHRILHSLGECNITAPFYSQIVRSLQVLGHGVCESGSLCLLQNCYYFVL